MSSLAQPRLSLADHNQLEIDHDCRYEYHGGEVFAMAGGDPKHSVIAANLITSLNNALRSSNCLVGTSDLRIRVETLDKTLYPDVSVVCSRPARSGADPRALVNPVLLVEVLSEGTAAYDRGEKFRYYAELSSLRDYVLVSQREALVQVYHRQAPEASWQMRWYTEGEVSLPALSVALPLDEFYRRTEGL